MNRILTDLELNVYTQPIGIEMLPFPAIAAVGRVWAKPLCSYVLVATITQSRKTIFSAASWSIKPSFYGACGAAWSAEEMGVPAERGRGWCVLMFIWRSSGAPSRAVLLLSPPVCTNSNKSCALMWVAALICSQSSLRIPVLNFLWAKCCNTAVFSQTTSSSGPV